MPSIHCLTSKHERRLVVRQSRGDRETGGWVQFRGMIWVGLTLCAPVFQCVLWQCASVSVHLCLCACLEACPCQTLPQVAAPCTQLIFPRVSASWLPFLKAAQSRVFLPACVCSCLSRPAFAAGLTMSGPDGFNVELEVWVLCKQSDRAHVAQGLVQGMCHLQVSHPSPFQRRAGCCVHGQSEYEVKLEACALSN